MKPEHMRPDTIDTIMAHEEELAPSSGFLMRVMERVQEEAAAPPPIPFPWKRAIPGIALAASVLGWGTVEMVIYALHAAGEFALPKVHLSATVSPPVEQAGWIIVALAVSAAGWLFSRRMADRSGLL
jgi:hypothetical protein